VESDAIGYRRAGCTVPVLRRWRDGAVADGEAPRQPLGDATLSTHLSLARCYKTICAPERHEIAGDQRTESVSLSAGVRGRPRERRSVARVLGQPACGSRQSEPRCIYIGTVADRVASALWK